MNEGFYVTFSELSVFIDVWGVSGSSFWYAEEIEGGGGWKACVFV